MGAGSSHHIHDLAPRYKFGVYPDEMKATGALYFSCNTSATSFQLSIERCSLRERSLQQLTVPIGSCFLSFVVH